MQKTHSSCSPSQLQLVAHGQIITASLLHKAGAVVFPPCFRHGNQSQEGSLIGWTLLKVHHGCLLTTSYSRAYTKNSYPAGQNKRVSACICWCLQLLTMRAWLTGSCWEGLLVAAATIKWLSSGIACSIQWHKSEVVMLSKSKHAAPSGQRHAAAGISWHRLVS